MELVLVMVLVSVLKAMKEIAVIFQVYIICLISYNGKFHISLIIIEVS